MKYIQKGVEPSSLSAWKIKQGDKIPTWKSFRRTVVKEQLLETLLQEQGYICCYCGVAIDKGSCHIEHFKPQGTDESVRFDYFNLIVSCQGEDETQAKIPVHCGHQKDNWYDENLLVSPLIANCTVFFRYSAAGEILPTGASTFGRNIILAVQKPYYMVHLKKAIRQKWMLPYQLKK
ncbi:retron system putative HNH endonuclease [Anabaena azotica]|uniref:retron system putative HNH endonuclease n=1 Tax=Anabaena azotica TaxID=197653 RepID=UPI0039A51C1D